MGLSLHRAPFPLLYSYRSTKQLALNPMPTAINTRHALSTYRIYRGGNRIEKTTCTVYIPNLQGRE